MDTLHVADRDHLQKLADQLGVALYDKHTALIKAKSMTGIESFRLWTMLADGVSFTSPDRSTYLLDDWDTPDLGYFIGLHELGHQALNHCALKISKGLAGLTRADIISTEIQAWQWALATATRPPCPETWTIIRKALNSYRSASAQELGVTA